MVLLFLLREHRKDTEMKIDVVMAKYATFGGLRAGEAFSFKDRPTELWMKTQEQTTHNCVRLMDGVNGLTDADRLVERINVRIVGD